MRRQQAWSQQLWRGLDLPSMRRPGVWHRVGASFGVSGHRGCQVLFWVGFLLSFWGEGLPAEVPAASAERSVLRPLPNRRPSTPETGDARSDAQLQPVSGLGFRVAAGLSP